MNPRLLVTLPLWCLVNASLLSPFAMAAGFQPDPGGEQFIGKILQVVLALVVTLGLIWGLSKIAMNKRWTQRASNQRIKVLDSLAIVTRDRIMLIEVDNQNILVASTPGKIHPLHSFEKSAEGTFQGALRSAESHDVSGGHSR